jgi:hypothetical protein
MGLTAWSHSVEPTPSGNIDTGFPTGDDGSGAIPLAWNTTSFPSLLGLSSAFSTNIRSFLSEPTPGGALITLRTVSGAAVEESGWTLFADVLANASTTANSGVLALDATYGPTTISLIAPWSRVAAGAADTTAPTIPLGFRATGTSAPVALQCESVSELFVSGQTQNGCRRINWLRNGSKIGETSIAVNVLEQPSLMSFGGATASYIQTGNQFDLTVNGAAGFNGTTDEGAMLGVRMTGTAWTAVLRVLTTPATTSSVAHSGLMVRATADVNSPFVQAYQGPTETRARARLAVGATVQASPNVSTLGPGDQKIVRNGNVFTVHRWDGANWALQETYTCPMSNVVFVGPCGASRATAVFTTQSSELSVSAAAAPTFSDSTPGSGSIAYSAKSEDLTNTPSAGNQSVASATQTVSISSGQSGAVVYKSFYTFADGVAVPPGTALNTDSVTGNFLREVVDSPVLSRNIVIPPANTPFPPTMPAPGTTVRCKALHQYLLRGAQSDKRVEISIQAQVPNFTEVWYGFSFQIRPTTNHTGGQMVFFQVHHTNYPNPAPNGANPQTIVPLAIFTSNGAIGLWTQYRPDLNQNFHDLDRYEAGGALDLGPAFHTLVKGVREVYVVRVIWDPRTNGNGKLQIWRNDLLVADITKPIGYLYPILNASGQPTGAYNTMDYNPHIGLYGSEGATFGPGDNVVDFEHSEFKQAVGTNLYNAVRPSA